MNTFVARGSDFYRGGMELDPKRLPKQLVECQQIYDALISGGPAHILHHPATQMWDCQLDGLLWYSRETYRAFKDQYGRVHKSGEYLTSLYEDRGARKDIPGWADEMAPYHKAKLYRKNPQHYATYWQRDPATSAPVYAITLDGVTVGWVYKMSESDRLWSTTSPLPEHLQLNRWKTAWSAIQYVREHKRAP